MYPSAGPGLLFFQVYFFTLPAAGEAGWARICGMGGDRRGAGEMSPPKPGPFCAAQGRAGQLFTLAPALQIVDAAALLGSEPGGWLAGSPLCSGGVGIILRVSL